MAEESWADPDISALASLFEGLLQSPDAQLKPSAPVVDRARAERVIHRWRQFVAHRRWHVTPPQPAVQPVQQPIPMAAAPLTITGDSSVFPERFDGTEDGRDWLGKFELYCRYKGLIKDDGTLQSESQLKSLLAVLLINGAKLWYENIDEGDRDTWAKLRALFVERFAEQKFLKFKHSKEMFTTKQGITESVREYISRIQTLARKASDAPSVDVIIHAVMAGVKGYIAGYLAEKAPTTLADLIKHATVAESTIGDAEPVSTTQLKQLEENIKAQFDVLTLKLSTGTANNVAEDRRPRQVSFARSMSRSSSGERQPSRYNRLASERNDDDVYQSQSADRDRAHRYGRSASPAYRSSSRERAPTQWQERTGRNGRNGRTGRLPRGNTQARHVRSVTLCRNCGGNVHNDFTQCPAYSLRCHNCSKWGHLARCCLSTSRGMQQSNTRGRYQHVTSGPAQPAQTDRQH